MLDTDEVETLEKLIRRMTNKQRWGLESWVSTGSLTGGINRPWDNNNPLWPAVKESQELVHWFEVPAGQPWGPPEQRRDRKPNLRVV